MQAHGDIGVQHTAAYLALGCEHPTFEGGESEEPLSLSTLTQVLLTSTLYGLGSKQLRRQTCTDCFQIRRLDIWSMCAAVRQGHGDCRSPNDFCLVRQG